MLLIQLIQDMPTWVAQLASSSHPWHSLLTHAHVDWSVLAQQQFNTDVFAGTRTAFDHFIKTGQVWALVIGLVLGYFIRSLTTYG